MILLLVVGSNIHFADEAQLCCGADYGRSFARQSDVHLGSHSYPVLSTLVRGVPHHASLTPGEDTRSGCAMKRWGPTTEVAP